MQLQATIQEGVLMLGTGHGTWFRAGALEVSKAGVRLLTPAYVCLCRLAVSIANPSNSGA
jgi:hypothetical protein